MLTFRIHLFWAAVLTASLVASFVLGHTHAAMRTWAVLALAISLAPVGVWLATRFQERRAARQRVAPAVARITDGEPAPAPAFSASGTLPSGSLPSGTVSSSTTGGN